MRAYFAVYLQAPTLCGKLLLIFSGIVCRRGVEIRIAEQCCRLLFGGH